MPTFMPPPPPPTVARPPPAANTDRPVAAAALDWALVGRFTTGDEAAFLEIMERHRRRVYSVAFDMLHNHSDAEEVTQDTFIRAYRGLANFRGDSSLATWLYRIAANLARNRYWHHFRRGRHAALSIDCALAENSTATLAEVIADLGPDPAQETATNEFAALVERCMEDLDAPHREILTLRNVLFRSYEDIAVMLGLNIGTVKSRIGRARERLRRRLMEVCPEFAETSASAEWFLPAAASCGGPMIACA